MVDILKLVSVYLSFFLVYLIGERNELSSPT